MGAKSYNWLVASLALEQCEAAEAVRRPGLVDTNERYVPMAVRMRVHRPSSTFVLLRLLLLAFDVDARAMSATVVTSEVLQASNAALKGHLVASPVFVSGALVEQLVPHADGHVDGVVEADIAPCGKQHFREIATPDWVGQFTYLTHS